jgi:hypothetical protein
VATRRASPRTASFAVIGAGAISCVVAGLIADRIGRAVVAASAMAASGACVAIGSLRQSAGRAAHRRAASGAPPSSPTPRSSALVAESADPRYIGTLTLQTCIGFLITTISIRLMPALVARVGLGGPSRSSRRDRSWASLR